MSTQPPAADLWQELNERQQRYLKLIYIVDRETEEYERGAWNRGQRSRPAALWRWHRYGQTQWGSTRLKGLIQDAGLIDSGTGSTLAALERRKLIKCRSDGSLGAIDGVSTAKVDIQITMLGRKVVRAALGILLPKKLPSGTLQSWQWEAIAACYHAGYWGLRQTFCSGCYGGIKWKTWLRLRDYKWGSLVEEYARYIFETYRRYDWGEWKEVEGWNHHRYIRLTPYGRNFYHNNWATYKQLYPDVEAVEPSLEVLPISVERLAFSVRHKRGDRGLRSITEEINQKYNCNLSSYLLSIVEDGFIPEQTDINILLQWLQEHSLVALAGNCWSNFGCCLRSLFLASTDKTRL